MNDAANKHKQALRILTGFLLGETISPEALATAKTHVAGCSQCWLRVHDLAESLAPDAFDTLFVESDEPFPTGPTFAEIRYLQSEAPPAFDLPGIWQRGRAYLSRIASDSVRMVIIALDPQQWPQPLPLAHRSETEQTSAALLITDLPGLEASAIITPIPGNATESSLTVEISMPARWPDFSGVRVSLVSPAGRAERITGASGRVTFSPVRQDALDTSHLIIIPPADSASSD